MTQGRLIAVVGPSGVGKDSVMAGLSDVLPNSHIVRRVITRAPNLGGEEYDSVTPEEFDNLAANGAFAVYWKAHGLCYGIPITVRYQLNKGTDCLVNFSRKALRAASDCFPNVVVLNITAQPDVLAKRLAARGRETEEEIARRLKEAEKTLPPDMDVIHLANDGPLPETVALGAALLQPASV